VNRPHSNERLIYDDCKLVLMLVCLMSVTLEPEEAKVTPLLSKDLTDLSGKEGLMITVEYRRQLGPYTSPQRTCVCLCA